MPEPVLIDGSEGEGGGQVLRTSLALSLITGRPVRITNVRARRRNPGLQAQHLAAVHAAALISGASVEGARPGSKEVAFSPTAARPGEYHVDIGTAGAVALVIQTMVLPLAFQRSASTLRVTGGTSVPFSPSTQYLQMIWAPAVARLGVSVTIGQSRAGYYPRGGGEVVATVEPTRGPLAGLIAEERGALAGVTVWSYTSGLPEHVGRRQAGRARERLAEVVPSVETREVELPSAGQGTQVLVVARYAAAHAGFLALGERGLPAERVADAACDAFLDHHRAEGAIEPHLADQLLLPLALAADPSRYTVSRVTGHLLTSADVIRRFLPRPIHVEGDEGGPGRVIVT